MSSNRGNFATYKEIRVKESNTDVRIFTGSCQIAVSEHFATKCKNLLSVKFTNFVNPAMAAKNYDPSYNFSSWWNIKTVSLNYH